MGHRDREERGDTGKGEGEGSGGAERGGKLTVQCS